MEKIHEGIDKNKDRHCDICGKFVNKNEQHKASFVFTFNEKIEEKIEAYYAIFDDSSLPIKEYVNKYYIGTPYDKSKNKTYTDWPFVAEYTLNDSSNPLSSPFLNRYLRNNYDYNKVIEDRIFNLNRCIEQFELEEDIVVFRGFSLEKNSHFVFELDKAYASLTKNKEPFELVDLGFVSTTRDPFYARFMMENGKGEVHVYCSIIAKKGVKCMPLSEEYGTTVNGAEKEVLFMSCKKYKIIAIEKYNIGTVMRYNTVILAED